MKRFCSAKINYRFILLFAVLSTVIGTTICFSQSPGARNSATTKTQGAVDINTADLKTLETLPGVGPATAQKIIDNRPYRSMADLGKIKGLTEAKLSALKDHVAFGPSPMAAPVAPAKSAQASTSTGATKSSATKSSTARAGAKVGPGEKININTANVTELDKLPGIGPAKAQAIIDYRTQIGNFKSIEDIQKVKGIKAGEFAKVKDHIKTAD